MAGQTRIGCLLGRSGDQPVATGFAPARVLARLSFADVLDEDTGRGYQRRLSVQHSLDFRRYILAPGSTTIPLTLNLRPSDRGSWRIEPGGGATAQIVVEDGCRVFAQVDCQHRLGHLSDSDVQLPFMSFVGLTELEEMEVFGVINSKARGLSTSLLDYHRAALCRDLTRDRPELYVALLLRNEPGSPWYQQLDLGGTSFSGLGRKASLRTMQKAVKRFLRVALPRLGGDVEAAGSAALEFWRAVRTVVPEAWGAPRRHMLTKGVGVYALMDLAAELVAEHPDPARCRQRDFEGALAEFAPSFDWTSGGPLKGLGGESGAAVASRLLRQARQRSRLRVVHA